MKRIAILAAGGDTPAFNAAIRGAAARARRPCHSINPDVRRRIHGLETEAA